MPELRWILIAFGVVLLVGIYVWGRRNGKGQAAIEGSSTRSRPEPAFESEEEAYEPPLVQIDDDDRDEAVAESHAEIEEEEAPVAAPPARAHVRASVDESNEANETTIEAPASRVDRDRRHGRIEPTFTDETVTAELPAPAPEPAPIAPVRAAPVSDAPTLSMSSTPSPRRIERRKIIALRLSMPERVPGSQLRAALESESLAHGKYDVFHRLDEQGVAIFSIASMVEPGTFDLEKMAQESYPGITLFAQLPGPVAGMLAFNELIACSKRLHAALGGTLQDERGVPLTVHRIERVRQEIRDFELRPASDSAQRSSPTYSPSP